MKRFNAVSALKAEQDDKPPLHGFAHHLDFGVRGKFGVETEPIHGQLAAFQLVTGCMWQAEPVAWT